ncbi:DUF3696 domain-containing protein [Paenibacillus sp. MBLB2552]|uniref:DUF3696 domain-containing protein n=1 Tax=Paenibacillus mellifer TaxID=2937794 RepID=A0A9X1XVB2_9BACL|nr:DUF3696 domain-containing protein [Paenibacillus mellifer]MCK8486685.1 DUF3696 domain-containing protein [Paenibacillus mellifer]
MINSIEVKNYKCFRENNIELKNASILLGINSGGKSSLIQSILLFDLALDTLKEESVQSIDLVTNKYGIELHSYDELINRDSYDNFFSISFNNNVVATYKPSSDLNVLDVSFNKPSIDIKLDIIYLGSNRYISTKQKSGTLRNIVLGDQNEYLGYIIEKGRHANNIPVYTERNYWNKKDTSLLEIQINDWLDFIFPGNKVTSANTGKDNKYLLLFDDELGLHHSNIGFGISFVLPIIVAGLIAKKGSVLIIENPELHLHPKAQSNIALFLSVIASSGVQVIIETHSEHIVNGFRKGVLEKENPFTYSDLQLIYFNNNSESIVENIILNEKVEINNWPEGFMDQEEKDLYEIRKMRLRLIGEANN